MNGMTMAKAVGTLVENAKGKSVKYKNGDLSYDIKCKYFVKVDKVVFYMNSIAKLILSISSIGLAHSTLVINIVDICRL